MQELDFPKFSFRFKNRENKVSIFDPIRKKFVILQPEEWVRQNCVQFLLEIKGFPKSLINIEKELRINDLKKRYDIVVFNTDGSIHLVVECKAPEIPITQATFDQIARYNLALNANYLMITNGLNHYYCAMNYREGRYQFLKDIPKYT
ncbi:type I restriction enzyme HsdR N-terminal domain-containing protein [Gaetbulibacter aestuarii]|uniref:Type I restriction enzyme HsdR N-terminal domain-containing protein n=1 Tax=Gaetbulibacter aestuarii TaxID=1502358 RepID=A0ABW7MZH7_9FLAO